MVIFLLVGVVLCILFPVLAVVCFDVHVLRAACWFKIGTNQHEKTKRKNKKQNKKQKQKTKKGQPQKHQQHRHPSSIRVTSTAAEAASARPHRAVLSRRSSARASQVGAAARWSALDPRSSLLARHSHSGEDTWRGMLAGCHFLWFVRESCCVKWQYKSLRKRHVTKRRLLRRPGASCM